jgi:hypothetical protein
VLVVAGRLIQAKINTAAVAAAVRVFLRQWLASLVLAATLFRGLSALAVWPVTLSQVVGMAEIRPPADQSVAHQ